MSGCDRLIVRLKPFTAKARKGLGQRDGTEPEFVKLANHFQELVRIDRFDQIGVGTELIGLANILFTVACGQGFLDKNDVTPKRLIRTMRHAIKRKQVTLELAIASQPMGARSSHDAAQFILQTRQAVAGMEVQLDSSQQTELTAIQLAAIFRVAKSAESIAAAAEMLLDQMAESTGEGESAAGSASSDR